MKMRVVSANVAPAKEKVSALCQRALGITAETTRIFILLQPPHGAS